MKDTSHVDSQAAVPPSDQLLNKAFKNASLLMALQIFAKVMTMSMNFLVARFVQKEIYGYANIQLQLFYSMILFYSKEAVRRACQREVQIEGQSKEMIHRSALNLVSSV
jgi:oligosaccharide translocation protein RFT1